VRVSGKFGQANGQGKKKEGNEVNCKNKKIATPRSRTQDHGAWGGKCNQLTK